MHRLAKLLALLALLIAPFKGAVPEPLLTPEESRRLSVENDHWRATRPTESVAANLRRLRAQGVPEADLVWFSPKLTELWDTGPARDFGWLSPDAVAAIRAVDRRFAPRLRVARVRREVGIDLSGGKKPELVSLILTEWHQAIVAALEPAQLAEFALCNSPAAVRVRDRLSGAKLTVAERRQAYLWESEFDDAARALGTARDRHYRTLRLEHWTRLRTLLGDPRAARYARAAEPDFAAQQRAWAADDAAALDGWQILETFRSALAAGSLGGETPAALTDQAGAALEARIGAEALARYRATPEGHWLGPLPRRHANSPR